MAKLVDIHKIQAGAAGGHAPGKLQKRCRNWLEQHPPEQPVTPEALQELKTLLDASAAMGAQAYALTGELYCRYHTLVSETGEPADQPPQPNPLLIAIQNRSPVSIPLELPARKPADLGSEIEKRKRSQTPWELPTVQPESPKDDISKALDQGLKQGF